MRQVGQIGHGILQSYFTQTKGFCFDVKIQFLAIVKGGMWHRTEVNLRKKKKKKNKS